MVPTLKKLIILLERQNIYMKSLKKNFNIQTGGWGQLCPHTGSPHHISVCLDVVGDGIAVTVIYDFSGFITMFLLGTKQLVCLPQPE